MKLYADLITCLNQTKFVATETEPMIRKTGLGRPPFWIRSWPFVAASVFITREIVGYARGLKVRAGG
jgi:hypothetical protein